MPTGGKKPGAGRPKGTVEAKASKAIIRAFVDGRLDAYLARLDELALTAQRPADSIAALKLLLDRAYGQVNDNPAVPDPAAGQPTIGDLLAAKKQE